MAGLAMVTLTKEQVEAIYDELDRRMDGDIKDGSIPADKPKWIAEERKSRLQGVYGTIMAIVPNNNWRDIVWWIRETERKRYGDGWETF